MGSSASKQERSSALLLCKGRLWHMKQAIDARSSLSAAQLLYEQSLRNVGIALRQFVEAHCEPDPEKSPSRSSYALLPPPPVADRLPDVSYMQSTVSTSLTVAINSSESSSIQKEQLSISPVLPPSAPPHLSSPWDFFDTNDAIDNVALHSHQKSQREHNMMCKPDDNVGGLNYRLTSTNDGNKANPVDKVNLLKLSCSEMEGKPDFITHSSKDFLFNMKEIEHQFTRAADSCHEVSRMLETRKIRLTISSHTTRKSSNALFLSAFLICCKAGNVSSHESNQHVTKVITWNRSLSSQSSSSRNPLMSAPKNGDPGESGGDFAEEFCMISGSHSSTLDRLYAWERKIYDELKAIESLRKVYHRKCSQLRHQFAKDMTARHIDKTRATVKDLHSQLTVRTEALYSISKRIEKLRDEEMQPQLIELIQGLMRMWRITQEIHHRQHVIVSLAETKISSIYPPTESYKQAVTNLISEIGCFNSSFANWVDAYRCYVDALHSWLQSWTVQSHDRSQGRKLTLSPRRHLAPPMFVLLRDWSTGIASLPSEEAHDSIKNLAADLQKMFKHQAQQKPAKKKSSGTETEASTNQDGKLETESKLANLQASLIPMFDRLAKFSQAMTDLCENVKQGNENARDAYTNVQFR